MTDLHTMAESQRQQEANRPAPAASSSGTQSIAMRVAKATDDDQAGAMALYQLLNAIQDGYFPPEDEDAEDWPEFDSCSKDALAKLHEKLMDVFSSGGLMRVLMAAHALLNPNNKLVDPEKDYLDDHPRFERQQQLCNEMLGALEMARDTIATALRANAPDWFKTDEDIAGHITIKRIDAAIAKAGA